MRIDEKIFNTTQEGYQSLLHSLAKWSGDHLVKLLLILLIGWLVKKYGTNLIMQVLSKTIRGDLYPTKIDRTKRLNTLRSLIDTILKTALLVVFVIIVISELGISTTPVLASAGIIGVALGFGAQSLIKDFTSGVFIITENQYRVGDVVELSNGVSGTVESIGIRSTQIRNLDGTLFHMPNGQINWTANKTISYAGINIDLFLKLDSNIDKAAVIVDRVGKDLSEDPKYKSKIKEPPHFVRVDDIGANGIKIKIVGKTGSDDSWDIKGAFLKQLLNEFRKAKIEVQHRQYIAETISEIGKKA